MYWQFLTNTITILFIQMHFYRSHIFPCQSLLFNTTVLNDIYETHNSVSADKKTKEYMWHTSVLFTGTIKLPNSTFHISKTTKLISTKFIYFLPYIYTTWHIKIKGNRFGSFWDFSSLKLPNFAHICDRIYKLTVHYLKTRYL